MGTREMCLVLIGEKYCFLIGRLKRKISGQFLHLSALYKGNKNQRPDDCGDDPMALKEAKSLIYLSSDRMTVK
jgi:hypothetical protein